MKKLCILPVLLCFAACDNNTITGKCLPHERTITTTEQNGQTMETSTTELFLCGCFKNANSKTPDFIIPKDEFSFEQSNTTTVNEIQDSVEYTKHVTTETIPDTEATGVTNTNCDRDCIELCNDKTQKN